MTGIKGTDINMVYVLFYARIFWTVSFLW